jgi:hypothetical protein
MAPFWKEIQLVQTQKKKEKQNKNSKEKLTISKTKM